MELTELKATIRKTVGNSPARALRRDGKIPAVVYGPQSEPISLTIEVSNLETAIKGQLSGQQILKLTIENGKSTTKTVMIKDLQRHPLSQAFIHADFYEIDMKRKIRVNVPVVTTGKSVGVEMGGMLQIVRRELEVLCLPTEIPRSFEIDITELNIGDAIHIDEIETGEGVEIPSDVNFTVLTILSPKVEEEEEEEVEEGEEVEGEEGETADETEDGEGAQT